ncbi:MAG: Gfo/Idh/MocA family oxidoreductase [Candidatus Omnitrophica bacterium]|nr:Gfo/Idh/MocA family oxidoreductase [Candidatus Omnitrophota bacterium]
MIKVGVIGYGYWGPNLVRNFAEMPNCQLTSVSDLRSERLSLAERRYPFIKTTRDYKDLLDDVDINAIAIATSTSSHFKIAMEALKAGKHVLVEKPLAATSGEASQLIKKARLKKRVLMVDHTFVYTGAVRKIHDLLAHNALGKIYYYDAVRVNLGLFQHDANVIWDLAVHDISVMDYVLSSRPYAVSATGVSHISGQPENIAYLTLFFHDSLIAHIHINWLAPVKIRRTLIGGSRKMFVYDDLEPSEKVKVYDRGIRVKPSTTSIYRMLVSYRTGNMCAPELDITEALNTEIMHFIRCIELKRRPITDGESGLRVVRILEAATRSMVNQGKPVRLE